MINRDVYISTQTNSDLTIAAIRNYISAPVVSTEKAQKS